MDGCLDQASGLFETAAGVFGLTGALPGISNAEDDDILVIAGSGLFDEAWYIAQNPDVARSGINPLIHYVQHGAAEGRVPFPGFNAARYVENLQSNERIRRNPLAHYILHGCADDLLAKGLLGQFSIPAIRLAMNRLAALPIFKAEDYLVLNEDARATGGIADVEPVNHALVQGFPEGRSVFMKTTVARALGAAAAKPFAPLPDVRAAPALPEIGVFYNAAGNAFIREIAEDIAASLAAAGQKVRVLTEESAIEGRPELNIFVAPHEFFHIGRGRDWAREEILRDGFLYTTEQPQTLWFERAMPFVLMARAVIDIAPQVADIFGACGMPAAFFNPNVRPVTRWLEPGDLTHPLVRVLPKAARRVEIKPSKFADRHIEIAFFGTESEHREKFFAKNARQLAAYEAFLYYRKVESPLLAKGSHAALSRLAGHVAAHSKLMLNIHRDSNGFFEWHRIAKLGMVSGAVVVSEPCLPHPVFKPGVHYLEESGRHILNLMEWLLHDEDGQRHAQKIQNNANKAVRDADYAARNVNALLWFLADHWRPGAS
jgi:hypothetical protein